MSVEELRYFSPAEFALLLELSQGRAYSVFRENSALGETDLTMAFASLYRRRLIRREEGGFLPESGDFAQIRNAPAVVLIYGGAPLFCAAVCYLWSRSIIWMVEPCGDILSERYRLRKTDDRRLWEWLLDKGLLEPVVLTDQDAKEMETLFSDELRQPSGRAVFRLEKYRNGGGLLSSYEILTGRGARILRISGDRRQETAFCTVEALSWMMSACFGGEGHDHRECQGTGTGEGV